MWSAGETCFTESTQGGAFADNIASFHSHRIKMEVEAKDAAAMINVN